VQLSEALGKNVYCDCDQWTAFDVGGPGYMHQSIFGPFNYRRGALKLQVMDFGSKGG